MLKGLWRRLGRKAAGTSLEVLREILRGTESSAGPMVTWKTALETATFLACARVLTEGVAQVPWKLYQAEAENRRERRDHPLFDLLHRRPNHIQSSFEFRETLMLHTVVVGNAFVFVNRLQGRVIEMLPLQPNRVSVESKNWDVTYKVRGDDGSQQEMPPGAIWHLRGPSWNGYMGLEAVALARDAIGLSIALEQAHAKLHKNGVHATGVYSVEGSLTDPQWQQLSAWIKKQAGGDAKGNPLILDHGAKWLQQAMTGVDAQHVETRMHQIGEIARAMRVMPIMIGLADKTATYASSEQMFLAHVVHTLSPWYERIEQSADVNLLTPEERDAGFYTKFQPNGLMRGAAKDRAEFFAKALGSGGGKGWMTQNEVRAADDMERSDDPEADKLPQAVAKPAPPPGSGGEQEDDPDASA